MKKTLTQRQRNNLENKRQLLVEQNNYAMTATLFYDHEIGIVNDTTKWNKQHPTQKITYNEKTGFYE